MGPISESPDPQSVLDVARRRQKRLGADWRSGRGQLLFWLILLLIVIVAIVLFIIY